MQDEISNPLNDDRGRNMRSLSTPTLKTPLAITHNRPASAHIPNHHHNPINSYESLSKRLSFLLPFRVLRSSIRFVSPIRVFYCQICHENHSILDYFPLSNCNNKHMFCKQSLREYLNINIMEGAIEFACPLASECHGHINEQDVMALVPLEVYHKFKRFQFMKSNSNIRECPYCNNACVGNPPSSEIVCEKCDKSFCFYHSNAHPAMRCEDYTAAEQKAEAQSRALIRRVSRRCPLCGVNTEKSGGCNHMTCKQCGAHWCWLCGRSLQSEDAAGEHYDPGNITGCPGQQFGNGTTDEEIALWVLFPCVRSGLGNCLIRVPWYILLLLTGLLGILLLLPATLCTIICFPLTLLTLPAVLICGSNNADDSELSITEASIDHILFPMTASYIAFFGVVVFVFQVIYFAVAILFVSVTILLYVFFSDGGSACDIFTCREGTFGRMYWCLPLIYFSRLIRIATTA